MSVHAKLMQARVALQSKQLKKSGKNTFAGYEYFELGDFLPVVQQIFHELGLCGVVSFSREIATLTITDVESAQSIEITSPMEPAALKGCHPIQNLGAVETYTRRYLWVTAMEIVEHDALDATTGKDGKKSGDMGIRPTAGAFESLPESMQEWLQARASEIVSLHNKEGVEQAYNHYHDSVSQMAEFEEDGKVFDAPTQQTALRSILPSNVKTSLRKYAEQKKG